MNSQHFEKWTEMARKFQEPLQAWAELNVKTVQGLSYMKPEELSNIKKPEELFAKQINIAVENSHKALEYMQKSFQIIENAISNCVKEVKKTTETKH